MRINSCPIPYLCLSFSVISSDRPPSFLAPPSTIHPPPPPCTLFFLLYIAPVPQMLQLSSESSLSSTHTPSSSIAILLQSLFFYACLFLTELYHSRGGSQSCRSHFIMWHSAAAGGAGVAWLGMAWHGTAALLSNAYTLHHMHLGGKYDKTYMHMIAHYPSLMLRLSHV